MKKNNENLVHEKALNLQNNTDFLMTVFKGLVGYAIIAADFDGNILAYNNGAEQIYGDLREDVVGKKNIDAFFAGEFMAGKGLQRMVAELMEKGNVSFEAEKVRKNGERFPAKCHFTLTRSNDGEIIGFVEITEDITALKRAQDGLRALNAELEQKIIARTAWLEEEKKKHEASEKRFKAMLESANDTVIGIEPPGVIYLWNSKGEAMFGYEDYEVIGKNLTETIVPEKYRKPMSAGLRHFFETGTGKVVGKTVEIEGIRKDGTLLPLEISISAINMRGVWNAIGIVRDITERKRAEEELRQSLDETERINRLMMNRELKIVELKKEMVSMKARLKEFEAASLNR